MAAMTTMTSAAVMAASTAMTTMTTMMVGVAAAAAVATVTTMTNKLKHRECSVAFLVEDVECRQADIPDFFLTEEDLIAICVA